MSDSTRDLLIHGVAAAKANSKNEARYFLEWLLRDETAERDEHEQARHWLAQISDDPKEKRNWLEEILAYNPMDPDARRELAILNGNLNPSDIINPDRLLTLDEPPKPLGARRFVCSNCGGGMAFDASKTSLACQYCGNRQSLLEAMEGGSAVEEQNFTVALATTKGHSQPTASHVIKCAGCGAAFQFQPQILSRRCSYCGTAYVLKQTETRELIPPEAVVPFAIPREQAHRAVIDWYQKNKFKILSADALPSGVYLPAWTFDIGGVIEWSCVVEVNDKSMPESGSALADENDLLVSASHTLSPGLTKEIDNFPLKHLAPYNSGFLADWAAETYTVPVSDASIVARARVLAKTQPLVRASITNNYQHLQFSTLKLVIDSYKLVLLPLWIARYRFEGKWYNVVVNGATGEVNGEKPARGISGWLAGWMGH